MKVIKPIDLNTDGSFARASSGTYFNASKVLVTATTNEPRFNYNPDTNRFEGLLLEPASTNLAFYSEDASNAYWTKTAITVASNSGLAVNGTTTADTITATATTAYISRAFTVVASDTNDYYPTVFVKAGTVSKVTLNVFYSSNTEDSVVFDLVAKTATGVPYTDEYILQDCGSGWFRIGFRITRDATNSRTTLNYRIWPNDRSLTANTNSVIVWGLQLEQRGTATSYIKTTTASANRSADVVTGLGLIYTDLVNANADWNSGTTYTIGQKVTYSKRIYESLQNTNLNKQPDTNPTFWLDIAPDNKHATLDNAVSTVSSKLEKFTLVLKPGQKFDSVSLINVSAASIKIAVTDPSTGNIYAESLGASGEEVFDWYQYFFYDPLERRTQIVVTDIYALYPDAVITILVEESTGVTTSVGHISVGNVNVIGLTQWGANSGIIDYSVKETDEFGNTSFVERAYSKRLSADIYVRNTDINKVQRVLYQLRATPCTWIATEDPTFEEALVVFGFYRDFGMNIAYPQHSLCNIEIEGLT